MVKRTLGALVLSALLLLPTAPTALATGTGHDGGSGGGSELFVQRLAAGINYLVDALDARIVEIDEAIAAVDARLAGDLTPRQRRRLEQERLGLVFHRDQLASFREAVVVRACTSTSFPLLAIYVTACGWT
jgi:hypothetical protein